MLMTPGMSEEVAFILVEKWKTLGKDAVDVIIDLDPEVCRLGYGDLNAVRLLYETSKSVGVTLRHQPGLRIGMLVVDDITLVFSPTPLLIEGGSKVDSHPNAILLGGIPTKIARDVGIEKGLEIDTVIGREKVSGLKIKELQNDLAFNPPVKFDIARKVRVFNAQFEFVEFEVLGCSLSRRTVNIPGDLMGLAKDEKTRKLLRSSFQLIGRESTLSGDKVYKLKQALAKKYMFTISGYGTVVLRKNKDEYVSKVEVLKKYIERFRRQVKKKLQDEIDTNREALVKALAPAIEKSPPERWKKYLGSNPSLSEVSGMLSAELTRLFGSAQGMLSDMEVSLLFKGVTYELLGDNKFLEAVRKAMPFLQVLHEEYDAAKAIEKA